MIEQAKVVAARLRNNPPNVLKDRDAADAIYALIAALEAAQRDAERYRWLKDSPGIVWDEQYFGAFMLGRLDEALDANKAATVAAIATQGAKND